MGSSFYTYGDAGVNLNENGDVSASTVGLYFDVDDADNAGRRSY